ncbi:ABC transporter ATP-binding protein [Halostagnicola bangensis]
MTEPLLEVENVDITYRMDSEDVHAVTNASFEIGANEYFGLVGESGCGKSTLAKSVIKGLDSNGEISAGTIRYKGREIQDLSEKEYNEEIRWKEISVIPQAAMNSLNPLAKLSDQAIEIANVHTDWSAEKSVDRLKELFDIVGLPGSRVTDYPHQFSGGMKQRAIIAMSLLLNPSLIIADEPTTALDVIMQDQFLKHIDGLRNERDLALLLITHDIAVVFETCDSMAVMHGGQIAEKGTTKEIFSTPRHPYTILLQQSFPDARHPDRELEVIEGSPPALREEVDYCTFASRCPWAEHECQESLPPIESLNGNDSHGVSCFRSDEMESLASEHLNTTGRPQANAIENEGYEDDD